jgi:hypothetical protein
MNPSKTKEEGKYEDDLALAISLSLDDKEKEMKETNKTSSSSSTSPNRNPQKVSPMKPPQPSIRPTVSAPPNSSSHHTGGGIRSFLGGLLSGFGGDHHNNKSPGICAQCNKAITAGKFVTCQEKRYHADCFRCAACNERLSDRICFQGSPPYPYHPECAQQIFDNSQNAIPASSDTAIPPVDNPAMNPHNNGPMFGNLFSSPAIGECSICSKAISSGAYLECQHKLYHQECFRCGGCQGILAEKVRFEGNAPYHPECAKELFNPRCCLCEKVIEGTYARHAFFPTEIYCTEHSSEGIRICYACNRKEPFPSSHKEPFIHLEDGRSVCPLCSTTMIMDSDEARMVYTKVLEFFQKELHWTLPTEMKNVPILAVDTTAINENRQNCTIGNHNRTDGGPLTFADMPMTRGLTLSTIGTIKHYNHFPSVSLGAVGHGSMNLNLLSPTTWMNLETKVFRIEHIRDVTAVLVLMGMPYDLFSAVLAHEATHVYIKLMKTIPFDLPSQVEEGLCQLISYKYLEFLLKEKLQLEKEGSAESNKNKQLSHEKDELHYFLHQIATDTSVIYGDGFRQAQLADEKLGLEILMEHVTLYKSFPTV